MDGGQSSTTALIADDTGRVAGHGSGGPCNHVGEEEGRAKFVGAIGGCLDAACEMAGIDRRAVRFESACLGFSGGPADKQSILEEMIRSERLVVTHDALIALAGATSGEPGLITIAGTGSIAFGRAADGRTARAGGWGYTFGDEGGGFDIARQALRAALRFEEGWGPPTALRERLLAATGARDANDLLHRFYTTEFSRPKVAGMARLVDQTAIDGDETARDILQSAAQQLATLASAVRGQLFEPGQPARVAYIGGVFRSGILLERYRMLIELEDGNRLGPPAMGPAAGALIEAFRAAGIHVALTNVPEFEK